MGKRFGKSYVIQGFKVLNGSNGEGRKTNVQRIASGTKEMQEIRRSMISEGVIIEKLVRIRATA